MNAPHTHKVRDAVSPENLVDLARRLIRTPSENPPGDEGPVAELLANHLRKTGWAVTIQEVEPHRPNIMATWNGGRPGPVVLFNGHLDVVPAGSNWTVDPYGAAAGDGRLYGRGACDMKGPIAAVVEAVQAVARTKIPLNGSVILTAVVGEEVDQCGTRHLVDQGLEADHAICVEPTGLVPVVAHKGEIYFDITLLGQAAHSSAPEKGINAIEKAAAVIHRLTELAEQLALKSHPLCGHPTLNVGVIHGGTIASIVPDRCTLRVDRRLIPGETVEGAQHEMEDVLQDMAAADPHFHYSLQYPLRCPAMATDPDVAVVRSLRHQTHAICGSDPGVVGWHATCDASLLAATGIPTCVFGPGDLPGRAHKPDEWIAIDELVQAAQIYGLTIVDLLGARIDRPTE